MPTTATYGLRYPSLTSAPNVPADMQNLANDTDAAIAGTLAKPIRYERQSGTQPHATGADLQVQFPTAVTTGSGVVASGTGNNCFTVAAGIWLVTSSIRCSATTPTREMTIAAAASPAATWVLGNVIDGNGSSSSNVGVSALVIATVSTDVTIGSWQGSGASIDVVAFGHLTHVAFARLG